MLLPLDHGEETYPSQHPNRGLSTSLPFPSTYHYYQLHGTSYEPRRQRPLSPLRTDPAVLEYVVASHQAGWRLTSMASCHAYGWANNGYIFTSSRSGSVTGSKREKLSFHAFCFSAEKERSWREKNEMNRGSFAAFAEAGKGQQCWTVCTSISFLLQHRLKAPCYLSTLSFWCFSSILFAKNQAYLFNKAAIHKYSLSLV